MNKLQGFYELQCLGIPTVPWKEFTTETELDENILWTVRTAVLKGNDFNLPRAIGVNSIVAYSKYKQFLTQLTKDDLIIYYPFFHAEKSGVLEVSKNKIIIEACLADLWNLVTHGQKEITYIRSEDTTQYHGNSEFLVDNEIRELTRHIPALKRKYKDYINEGKSVSLEWSFAYTSNLYMEPVGNRYLVFYECRILD